MGFNGIDVGFVLNLCGICVELGCGMWHLFLGCHEIWIAKLTEITW